MDISSLTVKILILLLPGAVAAIIVEKLTVHEKWSPFEFSIHSLILGFLSYVSHQLFWYCYAYLTYLPGIRYNLKILNFWKCLFDENTNVSFPEIFTTVLFSIVVGILISYIVQHKLLTRFANANKISTKFGDENLYSYFLNSQNVKWLCIRDKEGGFTYQGIIDAFSENGPLREITLRNVSVYTYEDSMFCYNLPYMYFSYSKDNLKIEVPILD